MEENKVEAVCQHCEAQKEAEQSREEMNFAILLAMIPLMVVTLFGQMGLF